VNTLLLVAASVLLAAPPKPAYEPTASYEVQHVEGWKVYVHKTLLGEQKELGQQTLRVLRVKLYMVTRAVPQRALAKLRQVPIWVEINPKVACACYHPSRRWLEGHGFNPEKAKAVEIGGPRNFLNWSGHQPSMVLHELAHAYHHRCLPQGYANPEIKAVYERARKSKTYEKCLLYNGHTKRAYAMKNPMEYFAELSEAYFGTNDFYPFVRAELMKHDPEAYKLLHKLWNQ